MHKIENTIAALSTRLESSLNSFRDEVRTIHSAVNDLRIQSEKHQGLNDILQKELAVESESRRLSQMRLEAVLYEFENKVEGLERSMSNPSDPDSLSAIAPSDTLCVSQISHMYSNPDTSARSQGSTRTIIDITDACTGLIEETKATYTYQIQMLRRTITALTEELTSQRQHYVSVLSDRDTAMHALRCVMASQGEEIERFTNFCIDDKYAIQDMIHILGIAVGSEYSDVHYRGA